MKILDHKLFYFLGIGGIGMSALARYFKHYGGDVRGYDKTPTGLTGELEREGMEIHYREDVSELQHTLAPLKKEEVLVIYTPAVPESHAEFQYLKLHGYRMIKRAVALGEITKQFRTIAVAGTHGKTTTTTLIAHLLKSSGVNCFAFMGGISRNYETNLLLGRPGDDAWVVVEADEYDRSFLSLHPQIAVITSVDADHLDIYGDASHVKEGYSLFAGRTAENGVLVVKKTVDNELTLTGKRLIYSLNLDTLYRASRISIENGAYRFDVRTAVGEIKDVELGVGGRHNVENAVAAVAVAVEVGIKAEQIKEGLRSFSGVKRRFEYRVKSQKVVYIDDYAHHPEELKATILSVKELYPGKKITGIFQPHLYSRTRDFADGFAESLDLLDECFLLDIYPAREKPIEGVSSEMLLQRMKMKDKSVTGRDELLDELRRKDREVLVSMGAGDIDQLAPQIERILKEQ